jgi:hypothetical protein
VYVGSVILPGEESRTRAYVKVFPRADRGQFVFNEVVAYQLALQCGLPSPFTFPCACRTALFPRDTVFENASTHVLGVASVDASSQRVRQSMIGASPAKWADLMNWPHVAKVAVFDELMANDDRHLENLIRRGLHDYVLIDNERILFGECWFKKDLTLFETRRCDSNILADTIGEGTDEVMQRRMLQIAQQTVMQTLLEVPSRLEAIESLCGAPAGTTKKLVDMLNRRRLLLPTLMQWHLRKGDLFQARTTR